MPRGRRCQRFHDPSLAGQDAQYLADAFRAYKDGSRSDETMKGLAAALDDNAIKNLSAFYASLQPQQPDVRKPLTTEEWTQRCDRCHGLNGNSTDPRAPALAASALIIWKRCSMTIGPACARAGRWPACQAC